MKIQTLAAGDTVPKLEASRLHRAITTSGGWSSDGEPDVCIMLDPGALYTRRRLDKAVLTMSPDAARALADRLREAAAFADDASANKGKR